MRGREVCKQHFGDANVGQRCKLASDIEARFFETIETGIGVEPAAASAGLSSSTIYNWIRRGEQEQTAGEASEFVEFLERLTRARASVHVRLAESLTRAAATGDWRAAAWMLERLSPEDFGKHRLTQPTPEHRVSVADELLGGRQPVEVSRETREKIIALLDAEFGE
jgi:transposase-like protein